MAKKGQKMTVFWPWRAEFCEIQKKAWTFSYFYPREAVYQISENLAHQTWRKCVTNGRTDGRTDERTGLKSQVPPEKFRGPIRFFEPLTPHSGLSVLTLFLKRTQKQRTTRPILGQKIEEQSRKNRGQQTKQKTTGPHFGLKIED